MFKFLQFNLRKNESVKNYIESNKKYEENVCNYMIGFENFKNISQVKTSEVI